MYIIHYYYNFFLNDCPSPSWTGFFAWDAAGRSLSDLLYNPWRSCQRRWLQAPPERWRATISVWSRWSCTWALRFLWCGSTMLQHGTLWKSDWFIMIIKKQKQNYRITHLCPLHHYSCCTIMSRVYLFSVIDCLSMWYTVCFSSTNTFTTLLRLHDSYAACFVAYLLL